MKPYLVCHSVNGRQFVHPKITSISDELYFYIQAENLDEVNYYCPAGEIVFLLATCSTDEEARTFCEFLRKKFLESLDNPQDDLVG